MDAKRLRDYIRACEASLEAKAKLDKARDALNNELGTFYVTLGPDTRAMDSKESDPIFKVTIDTGLIVYERISLL